MGTAIAKKQPEVAGLLQSPSVLAKFRQVAPSVIGVERFTRIALSEIMTNQALQRCTTTSVLSALMEAVKLGLEPGILGQCYLIPYGNTCTLIVGYKGLVQLARRSGEIASVEARAVRAGDVFEFEFGLTPKLKHVPDQERVKFEDKDITHVYAIIRMKDGAEQVEVMGKAQVDSIRARSKAGKSGPWVTDYEAMACKTVLRRALKLCPASVDVERAVALDEAADVGTPQPIAAEFIDMEPSGGSADDALASKIARKQGKPVSEQTQPETTDGTTGLEVSPEDQETPQTDDGKFVEDIYLKLKSMGPTNDRKALLEKYQIQQQFRKEDIAQLGHNDLLSLNAELSF